MAGYLVRVGETRDVYRVWWEEGTEEKRQHGKPSHRWAMNTKMDLRDVGWRHGLN